MAGGHHLLGLAERTEHTAKQGRVRDDGCRLPAALWIRIEWLLPPRPEHPPGCRSPRVPDRATVSTSPGKPGGVLTGRSASIESRQPPPTTLIQGLRKLQDARPDRVDIDHPRTRRRHDREEHSGSPLRPRADAGTSGQALTARWMRNRPRRPLSRGVDQIGDPTKPLVSGRSDRHLSRRQCSPLEVVVFWGAMPTPGLTIHSATSRYRSDIGMHPPIDAFSLVQWRSNSGCP